MLTISLRFQLIDANGADEHLVPEHPKYLDYEVRDSKKLTTKPAVSVDFNNALSRAIIDLVDTSGIESIPELDKARTLLPADREDGHRIADLLLSWARQWPDSRWTVEGPHSDFASLRDRSQREHIRLSAEANRYVNAGTDFSEAIEVGLADPMTDPDDLLRSSRCDGENCKRPCCNSVRTDKDHQPEGIRVKGGGGDKSAKKEPKKPTIAEINRKADARMADDGFGRPAFVAGRVTEETKRILVDDRSADEPTIGELVETIGEFCIKTGRPASALMELMLQAMNPKKAA